MGDNVKRSNHQTKPKTIKNTESLLTIVLLILAAPVAFGFTAGAISSPIAFILALLTTRTVSWSLMLVIMLSVAVLGAIFGLAFVIRSVLTSRKLAKEAKNMECQLPATKVAGL